MNAQPVTSRPFPTLARPASWVERIWTAIAVSLGAGSVGVAILQSPALPLVVVVLGVALPAATVFVREPLITSGGRQQYAVASSCLAAAVLVLVGIAHHLELGLTLAALLCVSSPRAHRLVSQVRGRPDQHTDHMARVGICEDDPAIRRIVVEALSITGHQGMAAHNGSEAIKLFAHDANIDVLVVDIGLPDADGRDVCQALRSNGQTAPVLFLTALGTVHDRLSGFNAGADDYLSKPFDIQELVARIEALAKRGRLVAPVVGGDLVLDPARHSVSCDDQEALLTPTEFRMLAAITSRPGEVVRRRTVVAAAWPDGAIVNENTVDSYVRRLRVKLAAVGSPVEIYTVRGVGFTLRRSRPATARLAATR